MTVTARSEPALPPEPASEGGGPPREAGGWVSRLGVGALIATAPAATIYLSFSNGGYFPNAVGLVAICFCAALVLRTTLADRPFEGYNRVAALAVLALAAFALLQLVSIAWSHTPASALDDYDRTFLYVLVFALFASLPRSRERVVWLTRSLAVGMSAVCLAALVTRVLPHVWPTTTGFYADRLNYPLGYWNALGLMAALACILLLHFASSLREPWPVRIIAAALFPAVGTTALLTYSRGALAVAILGLLIYAILGRPRGLITGLIAVVPTSAVAMKWAYDATLLSGNNPTSPAAVVQGRHVALAVGIAVLAAAALRAAGLWLDRWLRRPHPPPTILRRIPRSAAITGVVAVVVVALVAVDAPSFISREVNRFAVNQGPKVAQTRDRLTDPASNGRLDLWKAALHQFSHHVLVGEGAGTFQSYYAQHRSVPAVVVDTHSLYFQTLGEDGLMGIILLAIALVSILGALFWRWRGPHRTVYAALLAAAIAWAVHNAVDWDWQMPAVTLWLFAVGGLALAARREKVPRVVSNVSRTALAASFLVLAVAPLLIGFSYQRLRAAGNAFVAGNCVSAKDRALSSMSLLAVRPEAYEILGYCDLKQSYPVEALTAMRQAGSYDQQDWEYHYGLAIALAANGQNPMAEARRALQLNPLEYLAQDEVHAFQAAGPHGWTQAWRAVMNEGIGSSGLSVSKL